jgi:hypothetical protein
MSSVQAECAAHVRALAGPRGPDDSIKALIRRAARASGLGHRRVKAFWYGEAHAIRADEADLLRAKRAEAERRRHKTYAEALARLDALEAMADGSHDPEFYRSQLAQARACISAIIGDAGGAGTATGTDGGEDRGER